MSIKININNTKYEIPERLTVDQYSKAIQFDWTDPKYYPMIVSQLTGAPIKLLMQADEEAMTLAIALVIKAMNERQESKLIDLDSMTFGQFVDLDTYIVQGLDTHFKSITGILAPQAKYADEAMWAIDQYASFRIYTYRQYSSLFGLDEPRYDGEDTEITDKLATARSWYKIIVGLAHNNILQLDAVTEQPLKKVLNFMALQKEQQLEENQRKLKERRQYDLQRTRR